MILNDINYHGLDANLQYMSVSQFKDFMTCSNMAMAKIRGEYVVEPTKPMLIGSFVDAYFGGELAQFTDANPQVYTNKGTLRAEFVQAESIIARIKQDKLFMNYLSGDKQVMMTGELFGIDWKIKMDSYIKGKAIVDLKIIASIRSLFWDDSVGQKVSFIDKYGYDKQMAIYQKIVEINGGNRLPCFLAVADKGTVTDLEIIHIPNDKLDFSLAEIEQNINRIVSIKTGQIDADRCGLCDYCKATKVLTKPISYVELI